MDMLDKITRLYPSMTRSEKKIADYVLHNIENTLTMSTHSLAAAAGVSASMIIRFVRTLGFDTYAMMRLAIARSAELRFNPSFSASNANFSLDYADLQLCNSIFTAIVETRRIQNWSVLQDVAQTIQHSRMLYLYGIGTSGTAASVFHSKMIYINQPCMYHPDDTLSTVCTSHSGRGDVALGISYSGRNRDVLFFIETCRKNGSKTIGITQNNSALAKCSDYILPIPYIEDGLCNGANLSLYAQLVILDMLYLAMIHGACNDVEKNLMQSKENIERYYSIKK